MADGKVESGSRQAQHGHKNNWQTPRGARLRGDARGSNGGVREVVARAIIATGVTAMNWRKGLLRLWLVLSLCWIAGVGVYAWKHEPGISPSQVGYEIASSPEKQNEKEIVGNLSAELAKQYGRYVLLPPLITLALGLLGAWVVSSFERRGALRRLRANARGRDGGVR